MTRAELTELVTSGALEGRAVHLVILHDDACTPSRCVCEPEYVLEPLTVENCLRGAEAERRWIRETSA